MKRKNGHFVGYFFSFFALSLILGATTAFGDILIVPSLDYGTIQEAIDDASTGDTVRVSDGTFTGTGNKNLDFGGKAIIVESENGPDVCTIDCEGTGRGFYFHNSEGMNSIVSGFTITNGNGGGIFCDNASPTITDCIIDGNSAEYGYGGGIYCLDSSPTITSCTVSGNAALYGGGIYCENSSPSISSCVISDNTVAFGRGGGIYCCLGSTPTISSCTIIYNTVALGLGIPYVDLLRNGGGGIYCEDSSPDITSCIIAGNRAVGIWLPFPIFLNFPCNGGGIYCANSSPDIVNCLIALNDAILSRGGGLYCIDYSYPTITNCTISGNTASVVGFNPGGGIYSQNSIPTITNSILWGDAVNEINYATFSPVVTYSDVMGGYPGAGNINQDPLFFGYGDYHLQIYSPCIDEGTSIGAPSTDLEGDSRPYGLGYDMGADESTAILIHVPGDFPTIQGAINAAGEGDTVLVASGTYEEDNILIDKPLTLQGAGIDEAIIDASLSTNSGEVVRIQYTTDGNVTLDGFTIECGEGGNGMHGINCYGVTSSTSTIAITNNKIVGYGSPVGDNSTAMGLIAGNGSQAEIIFNHNEVINTTNSPVLFENHLGESEVRYNTLSYPASFTANTAPIILFFNYSGIEITALQNISNNIIDRSSGASGASIDFNSVHWWEDPPGNIGKYTNVQISNNLITYVGDNKCGIRMQNGAVVGTDGQISDPQITGNTITGSGTGNGIELIGLITNADVSLNTFDGVNEGFRGLPGNNDLPTGTTVNNNYFTNCGSYGVNWPGPSILEATNNWWGDPTGPSGSGPGSGVAVSDYVDFDPWLLTDFTVYEDSEDGETYGWSVYDDDPSGATVSNIYDSDRENRVIALSGDGTNNGYWLQDESGSPWHNPNQFILEWSMKCTEEVRVFADVETDHGQRYIYYTPVDTDNLGTGTYIHHGLGSDIMDGQWHKFVRDLQADLEEAQSGVSITEVNGLYIRGNGRLDDIKLLPPLPLLTINDVTIDEDAGYAVFTVTASKTDSLDVNVEYTTSDETAVAGDDYLSSSGTATVTAGSTTADINVPIIDDGDFEGDETFFVTLSNPTNGVISGATGAATITDNETPPPFLTVNDISVSEGGGPAMFTITASATSEADITVDYDTSDGTAVAPDDYTSSSGTATILSGFTEADVSVTIVDDTDEEGEEIFIVTLSNPTNAVISDDTADATIIDNDTPSFTVYEDAEDGDTLGWSVYDNNPIGATVANVYDTDRGSRVIELSGTGTSNGYWLQDEPGDPWHDTHYFVIEWSMKCTEEVRVFVDVQTSAGQRMLQYTPVDTDSLGTGTYVHHGLGSDIMDGTWRTFVRDLEADLKDAQPGVTITEVNGLYVRGSARFDDIKLWQIGTAFLTVNDLTLDEDVGVAQFTVTASETSSSDMTVSYATSDETAVAPDDYTSSSGTATILSGNTTVDVSVTIIDDTDKESEETFLLTLSNSQGEAVVLLDDTGVASIKDNDTPFIVYEDAEDGLILGWSIYDSDPGGATVSNVIDTDRGSRAIVLSGTGTSNGYWLQDESGDPWSNPDMFIIEWSMMCTSEVRVFVDVQTSAGQRLLQYTPVDSDSLGTGTYVHHGLGSGIMDGTWRTFVRDLEADLKDAQPSVTITEVNGLYIRGSARFDDIKLGVELPPLLSINDITASEDAGSAVFTITATETSESDITADYATSDGTAEAGSDYVTSSGTATILSGNTTVDVSVTITDDTDFEVDEDFSVILSQPTNAVISDGTGEASIPANDFPAGRTVYEDAEDGDTLGWSVYDNNPSGATVGNVIDTDRGSRVIELSGTGTSNGYELRNEDGSDWQNSTQTGFYWAMKSSEEVRVFVDVETDDGHRLIWYSTVDNDSLGTGEYVHHGLGSDVMDGQWHTFMRDLEADLQEAQSGVSITEVNGLYIRGSGSFDDIFLY